MNPPPHETLRVDQALEAQALGLPWVANSAAAIRLDGNGHISDATASAAAMLGFEPQDLRGRTLKDLALDGWQAAADVATARVRFGSTECFELALKGRSGRRTLVEMTARADSGAGSGAIVGWSERRVRRPGATQDGDPELKRVAYGLLRMQEAERMRVAQELHDQVGPIVIMVKYMIEDAVGRIGPELAPESTRILSDAALRLRDVVAELRRISADLRPPLLDDLGLVPALEWYCRSIAEAERAIDIECKISVAEAEIPERLKLDLFRIVEEALSNVVAHAHARRALVTLSNSGGDLVVMIEDNGEGFDLSAAMAPREGESPVGLQSLRKRVEATGGRLLFESRGQRGTRIGAVWRNEAAPGAARN